MKRQRHVQSERETKMEEAAEKLWETERKRERCALSDRYSDSPYFLSLSLYLSVCFSRFNRVLVPPMDAGGPLGESAPRVQPYLPRAFIPTRIYLVALLCVYVPTKEQSQI